MQKEKWAGPLVYRLEIVPVREGTCRPRIVERNGRGADVREKNQIPSNRLKKEI
jgi:hypothetical protein